MKVLYIQDSLGGGGAEKSNSDLWYYLKEVGIPIKIVLLDHRKVGIENEILQAGFDVQFLKPGSFWNQVNQIKDIIELYQPSLVHSVLFRAAMRTRFAKLKSNFIHVESLVNCTYDKIRYKDPRVNSTILKLYEKLDKYSEGFGVDHFVAITKEVKKHYENHLNIKPGKVDLIFRGRKENNFRHNKQNLRVKIANEIGVDPKGILYIHVGRQEFQKGHLDILKAISLKDEELSNAGAQFIFCGRTGNSTSDIEQFLSENKLKTNIKFLGHRNDIYKLLAISDIFIFPSLFEGLGGSLIEAQAAGLPIICSNIPVFQEVVTSENAIFHKTNDPVSLSTQLIKILSLDLVKMGQASLINFEKKFDLISVNKQMLDFYKSVI